MSDEPVSAKDIQRIAKYFRPLKVAAPDAAPFYDMLSDAIVWRDELPPDGSSEKWWQIRLVLNHRTCLLLSRPSDFEHLWIAAKGSFPEWIGFAHERCAPTEVLRTIYSDGLAQMRREFEELLDG